MTAWHDRPRRDPYREPAFEDFRVVPGEPSDALDALDQQPRRVIPPAPHDVGDER